MRVTIFFDLDGVLCDFVSGALAVHNATLAIEDADWGFPSKIGFSGVDDPKFWAPLGFDFWAGLAPYPDGFCLLRAAERLVGKDRIGLLTSPCETAGCVDGKRAWVAKHLPEYTRRLFVGAAKELFAGPNKVLVDDSDVNCEKFMKAGGFVLTPPRPWNQYKEKCFPGGGFHVPDAFDLLRKTAEYADPVVKHCPR
jgi:hypothetical protein